jgi:hypothetical protein
MPIINDSAPVFPVSEDLQVVRYMDLIKYISLLQRRALFFCRLDWLEDHFEGTTAKPNYESRINYHKALRDAGFYTVAMPDEKIKQNVENVYEFERKFKALNCVNCWNKLGESAALWKIYSDAGKGIMIRSSVSSIKTSLQYCAQEIRLSEVKYINYEKDLMLDGNTMYPLIHKHRGYSYEDEVRLLYEVKTERGWEYDWSREEVSAGVFIPIDVDELIHDVVIGPYSPHWYLEMIRNLTQKYGLDKPVHKSVLTPP